LRYGREQLDIQAEVPELTATVAGEPIDRDTLTWNAAGDDCAAQRERFDALARAWRALTSIA
jgi:hypothetical protein